MTLLTLLVTSFVPAWEKSNEQDFLNTAIFQLGQVKSANLNLMNSEAGSNNQYVPFTMTPGKVPLFGKNYLGNLEYRSSGSGVSSMTLEFVDSFAVHTTVNATGSLTYKLLNAYSQNVVVYEHGGVILSNIDGSERNSVFKSTPTITYTVNGEDPNLIDLIITQFDFVGTNTVMPASGTVGLAMILTETATTQNHLVPSHDLTVKWSTPEAGAWEQWAEAYFDTVVLRNGNDVTLTLDNVYSIQYTLVKTQMTLE